MSELDESTGSAFEEAKATARALYGKAELRGLVDAMVEKKIAKAQAENALSVINAYYDVLRFEAIPAKMDALGIENVRYDGVGRVSLTPDVQVSTRPGMKDKLFEWLRTNKLGDLIQPGINASTLKAFVKDRIKAGKEVPAELNVTPITRASITKT